MKNLIKDTLCKFGLLFFLTMVSIAGRAQVTGGQYTFSIVSATATANTIDFALTVTVTNPSAGMRMGGYSTSFNFNTAIINSGTISAAYVSGRDSRLAANSIGVATAGSIRLALAALTSATAIDMAQGTTLQLGTYRISNTANWASGNASAWLQNVLVSGKTNSAINGYPFGGGTAYTYTTTTPSTLPGAILSYTSTTPYSLTVGQVCATSGFCTRCRIRYIVQ